MEEILHQLIGSLSHYLIWWFFTSQVVQDFFHQQYGYWTYLLFQAAACPLQLLQLACQKVEEFWATARGLRTGWFLQDLLGFKVPLTPKKAYITP